MSVIALIVFVLLHFINAGYGMLYTKKWGWSINNRIGWIVMETPVILTILLLWLYSDRKFEVVPLIFLSLFLLHYVYRSFIFPLLLRGKGKMPISIILSGVVFNILNALMQGGWIFYISPLDKYKLEWLYTPQFAIGLIIFFFGFIVNIQSDSIIRNLRKPGDKNHYIPRGGFFRWVSSANYFGEIVEWIGFAILTWSWAGAVFAWWTFANLAPRARRINSHYREEFGENFTSLNLKNLIPFIY